MYIKAHLFRYHSGTRNIILVVFQNIFEIITVFFVLTFVTMQATAQTPVLDAVEQAHKVLWNKFIDEYGIIRGYAGETPTPEDCSLGRPNAIGWRTPISDGAFFTGLYLNRCS